MFESDKKSIKMVYLNAYPDSVNKGLKLLLMGIAAISIQSCFRIFCDPETSLIKTTPNYNQTKKAVLLLDQGNATVDYSLQVSIIDFNPRLSDKELGNMFTVDSNYVTQVLIQRRSILTGSGTIFCRSNMIKT